ncbi:TolC family protein [Dethiosulfovibrio salsuginis]|uniref:Outer membrane protein TolC n=1 Tax=Dethiosulfovibrio salsuginis TaxID=561720 RepID=A0A1X7KQC5_9BACT|nr:hypothetical protein [Dethiosulfovibrio salsuginis]SMG43429.1 Outer membrane protein TolC [Dethiosulfovibrio salsuginis]
MAKKFVFCVLFVFFLVGSLSAQPLYLPNLQELEEMVCDGPEVLSSLAALTRDEHLSELAKTRIGGKLFLGLSYGYSDEPINETSEERLSYRKATVRGGVRFPILGTWTKEKISVLQGELRALEGRILLDRTRELNLTALRKAYVVIWGERRKRRILEDFLSSKDETEAVLSRRVSEGLLLESDRFEFMSAYDMAFRDLAASSRAEGQALNTVRLATGRSWSIPQGLQEPSLPGWSGEERGLLVDHISDVKHNDSVLDLYRRIAEMTDRIDREGTLEIGVSAGRDFPGTTGTGAYVSVTVEEPFRSIGSEKDHAKLAAMADLDRRRADGLVERIRLEGELDDSMALLEYGLRSLVANTSRVKAASEAVRVNSLRHGKVPGDTYEKLQIARYDLLRTSLDVVDSQVLILQAASEVCRFLPESLTDRGYPLALLKTPVPSAVALPASKAIVPQRALAPQGVSVYLWEAAPFLDSNTRGGELERMKQEGFSRVLLSFNGQEVRSIRDGSLRASLDALLNRASALGITVDLLLGDPAWILPEHRLELVKLVQVLSPFPFRGLHLDLEPDSLPNSSGRRAYLAGELIRTLEAVRARTTLPISISAHPRYFEGELGTVLGKGLEELGIEEVALMIYSTDRDNVVRRMGTILAAYPGINFSLAQSIEPILSPKESYYSAGRSALWNRIRYYDLTFDAANYRGSVVQAWKDYKEAKK